MTPRAVLQTLDSLWAALEPLELPMALMGGLALSAWKYVRATRDVDVLVGVDESATDDLLACLAKCGFRPKRSPPILSLGAMNVLQLEFEPDDAYVAVQVDLLLVNSAYHADALRRRVRLQLPDAARDVFVLSCEDLILHKLLAGRIIDRADAAALLRANRDSIDTDYLAKGVKRLQLEDDFREVWEEAFSDNQPPI